MSDTPIADYAMISDCRSAALISRDGSVDWLCFPRFDGPSVFGRILDDTAGHFSIRPTDAYDVTRCYRPETLVLETTFTTKTGTARLVDTLAVGKNERGHQLGANAPGAMVRVIEGVDGVVDFAVEYVPRPEYGLIFPLLEPVEGRLIARGGGCVLGLSTSATLDVEEDSLSANARVSVHAGQQITVT